MKKEEVGRRDKRRGEKREADGKRRRHGGHSLMSTGETRGGDWTTGKKGGED